LVGMQISTTTYTKQCGDSSKSKDRTAIWSIDTTLGHLPKGM
jgi:hypothetical protein